MVHAWNSQPSQHALYTVSEEGGFNDEIVFLIIETNHEKIMCKLKLQMLTDLVKLISAMHAQNATELLHEHTNKSDH